MHIIDTHLHLVYPQRVLYPWIAGSALDRAFHLDDYRQLAVNCGIRAALHMEVDVAQESQLDEVAMIAELAAESGGALAGQIAACRPESGDFARNLGELLLQPTVKGVRRILHTSPDDLSQTPLFAANLRLLAAVDYSFDLCVLARQLRSVALPLVQQCPEVRFVLDHCGVPAIKESTDQTFDEWKSAISELAGYPNLHCKLSGLVAYANAGWNVETLRPYAEHVIASFGWDRVVWGSDWPVCTLGGGLIAWVDATRTLLRDCSADQQARLLHRNAETFYRLGAGTAQRL